jgi:hypothetical protein
MCNHILRFQDNDEKLLYISRGAGLINIRLSSLEVTERIQVTSLIVAVVGGLYWVDVCKQEIYWPASFTARSESLAHIPTHASRAS